MTNETHTHEVVAGNVYGVALSKEPHGENDQLRFFFKAENNGDILIEAGKFLASIGANLGPYNTLTEHADFGPDDSETEEACDCEEIAAALGIELPAGIHSNEKPAAQEVEPVDPAYVDAVAADIEQTSLALDAVFTASPEVRAVSLRVHGLTEADDNKPVGTRIDIHFGPKADHIGVFVKVRDGIWAVTADGETRNIHMSDLVVAAVARRVAGK